MLKLLLSGMNKTISKIIHYGKQNYIFLICIFLFLLFIYGIKLFNFTIGIDSDIYYMDTYDMFYKWHAKEWRYGITLIQLLFLGTSKLNQYFSNYLSVVLLGISCFLWCYILNEYYKTDAVATVFFIVFYLPSIVWLEIMYFTYMAFACFLAFAILPLGVILLDEAIMNKNGLSLLLSLFILVLCLSIYQPMGALYLAGILIILFSHIENDRLNINNQWQYLIRIVVFLVVSALVYFLLSLVVTKIFIKVDLNSYVSNSIGGGVSFFKRLKNLLICLYSIICGELNHFNKWVLTTILKKPENFVELFNRISLRGSLAFLPAICYFIYYTIQKLLYEYDKYSIVYLIVSSGILVSAILINLLGDGISTSRYMHALPLVYSFLLFFLICNINKVYIKNAIIVLIVLCAFRFCFNTTLLQESDLRRYALDVELSNNINSMIQSKYSNKIDDDTKVLIIGKYDFDYGDNYLKGDIMGNSAMCFGCENSLIESTLRAIPFMKTLGYNYNGIESNNNDIIDLREYSIKMPKYPDIGCIDLYKNVIIVKLNDFSYIK